MSEFGYIPENFKTGTICIDSYEAKNFAGRLWYPCLKQEKKFDNLMQLVQAVDEAIKTMGYPDEFSQTRTFSTDTDDLPSELVTGLDSAPENGKLATFRIKIIFLQNATWQGVITWTEKNEEESFRSLREMIYLMDSVLSNK